jgi:cytochrome c biogenesis protein CcdA
VSLPILQTVLAGAAAAVSIAVLPYLPSFVLFNVTEKIGLKRLLARIGFFSAGVVFSFILSIWAVSAAPQFFITYSAILDVIWGLIVLYLGYIVIRRKSAFVIKAARDMFVYWCYGTFLMGTVFGAIWVNYLSMRDYTVNTLFEAATYHRDIAQALTDSFYYSLGLALAIAAAGAVTFALAYLARNKLAKHRFAIKTVCGAVICVFAAYIILSDWWMILTHSRLPF